MARRALAAGTLLLAAVGSLLANAQAAPPSAPVEQALPTIPDSDDGVPAQAPAPTAPEPAPPPEPPPPVAPPSAPAGSAPRYGDRGTSEATVGLGYSSAGGIVGAAGFSIFVSDAIAPGLDLTGARGTSISLAYALALASLRLVPFRTPGFAIALTGRAGRMLVSDHDDGWAAGGEASVVFGIGGGAAIEVGYQLLRLLPAGFCADMSSCNLQGLVFGVHFGL
jgi:hypothetical protein